VGLELQDLLRGDHIKKNGNELLVELNLGSWRKLSQNKSKAAESGISYSWVLVLKSLACCLHSEIKVLFQVVSARLSDQTEGKESSLSNSPVSVGETLSKDGLGGFEDEVLLHVEGESSDSSKTC
jgi:hypothetical protein